jgi:alanine dehydrogenase
MIIGIPKEIKNNEGRVSLIPTHVKELIDCGHTVYFEKDCGLLAGIENTEYINSGALQINSHKEIFEKSELIIKVKEIIPAEFDLIQENQTIVGFFHLTADKKQLEHLEKKNATIIDYEYFRDPKINKRVITMSPIAGRLGVMQGLNYLLSTQGGIGVLPMGVPGVEPANVTILGAGDAGLGAIKTAVGMGTKVTVLLRNVRKLQELENIFGNQLIYKILNRQNIEESLKSCDVFVNCIYWDKLRTDHMVYEGDLKSMKKSAVIVDISCDINGGVETCRATTHDNPVYKVHGITHYCVDNIPGAVAATSSRFISAQSFPFMKELAKNIDKTLKKNQITRNAVLLYKGKITNRLLSEKWNKKLHNILEIVHK